MLLGTANAIVAHDIKDVTYCEYYNETMCVDPQQECFTREECSPHDTDKRNHCYVLWERNATSGQTNIKLKVRTCFSISIIRTF